MIENKKALKDYIRILIVILLLGGFLLVLPAETAAASIPGRDGRKPELAETDLCLGLYTTQRMMLDHCWPMPDGSLPARDPDPALAEVPYQYLRVLNVKVPLYWTVDDAVADRNSPRRLLPGFDFVSVYSQVKASGGWYYLTSANLWMPGKEAEYWNSISSFQGLEFTRTPDTGLGWVLSEVESQRDPGTEEPVKTGKVYPRYQPIAVYREVDRAGTEWLQIGPREWIPAQNAAWVQPDTTQPRGVEGGRWIKINLEQQLLTVYENGQLVYATLVATGVEGFWTRPGSFQIKSKLEVETMRGSFAADRSDYYYLEDVPWTMYFDQSRALHGAYWHDLYGTPQSKGCVNLSPGDAHFLFQWAEEGDWVHVWDPSGETPTDSDLYQAGGA